jgi:hypothetical protein
MKHLLNNLSEQEKNAIREQHAGGMKLSNEKFRNLVEGKLGDVKTLVKESNTSKRFGKKGILEQLETKEKSDINSIMDLGYRFMMSRNPDGPKNKEGFESALEDLKWIFKSTINNIEGQRRGIGDMMETKQETKESFWDLNFGRPSVKDAAKTQLKGMGYSHMGKDDERGGDNYIMFNGEKFFPDQIEYADYQDLGDLPRIEDGKLLVANPAWGL